MILYGLKLVYVYIYGPDLFLYLSDLSGSL